MLSFSAQMRVFIATGSFDMRGSFDALAGASRRLGYDPVDGHLYVFLNKRRQLIKILHFDGTGWWVFQKRLERGSFELPPTPDGARQVAVDGAVLASILEGIALRAPRRGWYRQHAPPTK